MLEVLTATFWRVSRYHIWADGCTD